MTLAVHALTALLLAVGVALVAQGWGLPLLLRVILGGPAVVIALYVSPLRWSRRTKRRLLSRHEAPVLFQLSDEVASALGTKPLDHVRVSGDYNASYSRNRGEGSVMTIGWALWAVLEPQERAALIGHELGHQLNGDLRRSLPVYTAIVSLGRWANILTPVSARGLGGPAILGEAAMFVLLIPIVAAVRALQWSLFVLSNRQGLSSIAVRVDRRGLMRSTPSWRHFSLPSRSGCAPGFPKPQAGSASANCDRAIRVAIGASRARS